MYLVIVVVRAFAVMLRGPTGVPVMRNDQSLLMDSVQVSVPAMILLSRHILNVSTSASSNGYYMNQLMECMV